MKTSDTKILVQGALFVAIYCVFFLVSRFAGGLLESSLFFILPIPLAIFTKRYGVKKAFIPFVAILILGFIFNPISTLFYVLTANVLGIVYGLLIKKDVKDTTILLICALTSMVVNTLTMILFASLFEYDIMVEINMILGYVLKLFKIADEAVAMNIARASLPTFIFFIGLVEGFLIHISTLYVMKRLRETDRKLAGFYFITLPRWISFVYIPIVMAYFVLINKLGSGGFIGVLATIEFNLLWCGVLLFFIQGYLSGLIFAKRKGKVIIWLLILLGLIVFNVAYAVIFVALVGYVFVISDYHKKILYNK